MLNVTRSACEYVSQMLVHAGVPDGMAARLVADDEGLGLQPDHARDDDATYDHEGRTVLLLSPDLIEALEGRTLDVTEGDEEGDIDLTLS